MTESNAKLTPSVQVAMTTPARRQYLDIKAQHQDAILLYQIGDFYETFDEDAHIAARELQIMLTGRSYGPGEHVPLAGVPIHALESYAAKLVARGYKVAICDQVSPPGRGLVQREVTRILTPGTVVEPSMVSVSQDTYLVALNLRRGKDGSVSAVGLAYVDAAAGLFRCTEWLGEQASEDVTAELHRIAPAEILLPEEAPGTSHAPAFGELFGANDYTVTACPAHYFDSEAARARLCRHLRTATLTPFGCEHRDLAISAAGAVLTYLDRVNPALSRLVTSLQTYDTGEFVEIDSRTWRALEVVEPAHVLATSHGGSSHAPTLLATIDATRTAMGARLLRRTLLNPLRDRYELETRLAAVAELYSVLDLREVLAGTLRGLPDLERMAARVVHGTAVPRELMALAAGLARVTELVQALRGVEAPALDSLRRSLDPCDEVRALIRDAIADPTQGVGRTIRAAYNADLDQLINGIADARAWIATLETTERQRTGIKSLKVGFNKVFGYYLDVSRPNLDRVPDNYQRRQTLANGERFVTAELKEHEALVLHAEEKIEALERELYASVLQQLATHQARLLRTAHAIAQVDVWLALAEVAIARNWVRPELTDSTELELVEARHPIVEATLDGAQFIPNDTHLDGLDAGDVGARLILLTGPNMAGKSTYLRQVASIVLLAHIGSFVPATHARIGLVDRIFTRVGAQDDLARGLSTFMVEMVETGYILRHATPRSLVILDEVGRGTSTHDGLAIARAVIEHLHSSIGARTLFATHYHELAEPVNRLPHARVYRMEVVEHAGEAIFLHRVVPGTSTHSYGIQVARMAGLPAPVIQRAVTLLEATTPTPVQTIAESSVRYGAPASICTSSRQETAQSAQTDPVRERELALALASLNIAAMTPLESLNLLFSLQQRALATLRTEMQRS